MKSPRSELYREMSLAILVKLPCVKASAAWDWVIAGMWGVSAKRPPWPPRVWVAGSRVMARMARNRMAVISMGDNTIIMLEIIRRRFMVMGYLTGFWVL